MRFEKSLFKLERIFHMPLLVGELIEGKFRKNKL